jgi:hypothetical protein
MQQFNQTNHDFEIQLERDSIIEPCADDGDAQAIPDIQYHVSYVVRFALQVVVFTIRMALIVLCVEYGLITLFDLSLSHHSF